MQEPSSDSQRHVTRSTLGLVIYCCQLRRSHLKRQDPKADLFEPLRFLEHCLAQGAGGMQVPLGTLDPATARQLRRRAEETGLFIEAILNVPNQPGEVGRFEAEVKSAVAVGAVAARTVIIPGRRYEYFDSLEKFRELEARGQAALERAAPIVEKYRLPLAVENHKDHRAPQRVALLKHISSEYVGACVDTGNSLALLEDPLETVTALAPWAHSVHLKDQAVAAYEQGFLLGDVPLGQGVLDLPRMVDALRTAKPRVRCTLELITRDALEVPCLTDKYWATFPEMPASDLARTLQLVRERSSDLQSVSALPAPQQLELEDDNIRQSLAYAESHLALPAPG